MQNLDVAVALSATLVALVYLMFGRDRPSPWATVAAGSMVGLVAALAVLVVVTDVVPDRAEAILRPLFFAAVAVVLARSLWYGLARR